MDYIYSVKSFLGYKNISEMHHFQFITENMITTSISLLYLFGFLYLPGFISINLIPFCSFITCLDSFIGRQVIYISTSFAIIISVSHIYQNYYLHYLH